MDAAWRVYLIDAEKQIRNIYSVAYLHPDTLFNDIRSLQLESAEDSGYGTVLQGPGDDKKGL